MPEISLCWRSLNGEPVVWVGCRVWRGGLVPYGFLMVHWDFVFEASGKKRFYIHPKQSCLLGPGVGNRVGSEEVAASPSMPLAWVAFCRRLGAGSWI